jgi:SAM-dependent methyltransferase
VRFASLANQLFPHSGFPTLDKETVFFGPDTYRFSALIQRELRALSLPHGAQILDVGCGTGAGGLVAAMQCADLAPQLTLADISPVALEFARASTALSGLHDVTLHQGDLFNGLPPHYDLIIANPPYLNDESQRLYRHGGGRWGEAVSIRILQEGLPLLAAAGRMILYTGSCIAGGVDHLREALTPLLQSHHCQWRYEEIDPDVFGEELQRPAYSDVERIAVVAVVVRKS